MKKEFKFDFIKYFPELKESHKLSPLDVLVYWYIKAVIEFKNNTSCFVTSPTMAKTLYCNPWSIDNSIKKLKDKKLIEIKNEYIQEYNIKRRYIYLPWTMPKWRAKNEVDYFFDKNDRIEDNPKTRAIVWNLIFKHNLDDENIMEFVENKYDDKNAPLDENDLRDVYIPSEWLVEYQK